MLQCLQLLRNLVKKKKIKEGFLNLVTIQYSVEYFTSDPIVEEYFMVFKQTHLTSAYPP